MIVLLGMEEVEVFSLGVVLFEMELIGRGVGLRLED